MTTITPHVGDTGTSLRILFEDENNEVLDISAASIRGMLLKKPDGTLVTLAANFVTDGTDGLIEFTTLAGTFNIPGRWTIQGHIVSGGSDWHSTTDNFKVLEILA